MAVNMQISETFETKLKKPKKYKVVMHNDDFTPMDVVVEILIEVFHKDYQEAVVIMMTVHKANQAIVGCYSYDIANTKTNQAISIARALGYPLRVTVEG